MVLFDR